MGAEVRPIPPLPKLIQLHKFHPPQLKFSNTRALLFSHFVASPQTFWGKRALVVPTVKEGFHWVSAKIPDSAKEVEQKEKQLLVSEDNQKPDRHGAE